MRHLLVLVLVFTATPLHADEPEPVQWHERDEDPTGQFWVNIYDPHRAEFEDALIRGVRALQEDRKLAALKAFQEALTYKPDNIETLLRTGYVTNTLGEHELAISYFLRVRELHDDADQDFELCFSLATAYAKLERWDDTLAEYDRCLLRQATDSSRLAYLGNAAEVHMANGQLERAVEDYRAALQLYPDYIHALFGLAVALERLGQRDEARTALRQGFLQDPTIDLMLSDDVFFVPEGDIHYHLGLMLDELGQLRAARARYTRYLETAEKSLFHDVARARLKELAALKPPMFDTYPTPETNVSAAVVDTRLRYLVLGTTTGRISMIELDTQKVINLPTDKSSPGVVDIAFTPKGKEVRVLLEDHRVLRLDASRGLKTLGTLTLPDSTRVLDLTADGRYVLYGDGEKYLVREIDKPKNVQTLETRFDALVAALHPKRTHFLTFPYPFTAQIFDTKALDQAPTELPALQGIVLSAEFLPGRDDGLFALASQRGLTLARTDGTLAKFLLPPSDPATHSVATDPSGRYLVVAHETMIQLWDLDRIEGL